MHMLGMQDANMSEEYKQLLNEKQADGERATVNLSWGRGGDGPRWEVPRDVPAAYGGLVRGLVWSSWDASLRQGNDKVLRMLLTKSGNSKTKVHA
eukprot:1152628-Pelagomonas_calceolata.AAC.2